VRVVEGEKVIKVPEGVKEDIKDVCVLLLRGRPGLAPGGRAQGAGIGIGTLGMPQTWLTRTGPNLM
jgi:hypothetical protein